MVSEFVIEDLKEVNILGKRLNPNFEKLFHVDKLNDNEKIYVYKENNNILGFIHISINYEVVDLLNIIVNEEFTSHNIGSILMDYMISSLPSEAERIMLEVRQDNVRAIKFYYKFNFEVINIRKSYYDGVDAIIMERLLN